MAFPVLVTSASHILTAAWLPDQAKCSTDCRMSTERQWLLCCCPGQSLTLLALHNSLLYFPLHPAPANCTYTNSSACKESWATPGSMCMICLIHTLLSLHNLHHPEYIAIQRRGKKRGDERKSKVRQSPGRAPTDSSHFLLGLGAWSSR